MPVHTAARISSQVFLDPKSLIRYFGCEMKSKRKRAQKKTPALPAPSLKLRESIPAGMTIDGYAKHIGIARATMYRLLSGNYRNVNRMTALRIQVGTNGAIKVEDWNL